jgi:hypothetical protein
LNIQLVPVDSYSRGIALDCEILERLAGCKARIPANEYFPPLRYLFGDGRSHVSLFVETVPWWAAFLPRRLVWVIWNHEIAKTYPFVWLASRILCKTHIAERIAKRLRLGQPTRIGFTSSSLAEIACPPPAAARPLKAVLHLAGQSTYKQTQQVLQAWVDHPELPRLVVTCFGKGLSIIPAALRKRARAAANVDLWDGPAPREKVEAWLREIPVHLCPSCAEGFGHSLNESRFYGACCGDWPPAGSLSPNRRRRHRASGANRRGDEPARARKHRKRESAGLCPRSPSLYPEFSRFKRVSLTRAEARAAPNS